MSDNSDGLGGAAAGPGQPQMAQANAAKPAFSKLLGPRAGRDVSPPAAGTAKAASPARDQAARSQR